MSNSPTRENAMSEAQQKQNQPTRPGTPTATSTTGTVLSNAEKMVGDKTKEVSSASVSWLVKQRTKPER